MGPQESMLRIACDAPCDFGCVIFAEYLLIPGLEVAIARTNLQSTSSSFLPLERRNTIDHMHSSTAIDGYTVSAYKASTPTPAEQFSMPWPKISRNGLRSGLGDMSLCIILWADSHISSHRSDF